MLVIEERKDSGKTFDLTPNCLKGIQIEDQQQEGRYHQG